MAKLKGFYINLDRDKERERILRDVLNKKGKLSVYEKFTAIEGNTEEASKKSLRAGEQGIWKTWIELLKKIEQDSDEDYDYVHIIEDDVIVSDRLYCLIEEMNSEETAFDIIMTDMYTNVSVYKVFEQHVAKIFEQTEQLKLLTTSDYTGCIPSCIVHRSKIKKIRKLLEEEYKTPRLIPIDNFLRKKNIEGELAIITTIPFLTTVQLSSISASTIQERQEIEDTITNTQIYNTFLRRRLSIFREETGVENMVKVAKHIAGRKSSRKERLEAHLIDSMNTFLESERALRYRIDERLQDEDNPQAKRRLE